MLDSFVTVFDLFRLDDILLTGYRNELKKCLDRPIQGTTTAADDGAFDDRDVMTYLHLFLVSRLFPMTFLRTSLRAQILSLLGGSLLAMKGVQPLEEIAQLNGRFRVGSVTPLKVPGLDAERHLIFLQAA